MITGGPSVMTIILLIFGALSYPAVLIPIWLSVYSLILRTQSFALAAEVSATRVRSQTISIARNSYSIVQIIANTIEPYLINPTEANPRGKTAFSGWPLRF
jgi:SP family general alpha glucoside:H+ symporter-like MFS transporter